MISYFPTPYEDELWYSVLSRYHARSGNIGVARTNMELFENEGVHPSVFFANRDFGGIFGRLPKGMLDKLAAYRKHTMIPYVLRFVGENRKQEVRAHVLEGKQGSTGNSLFSMPGNQYMRYCPRCSQEDEERHGELYWHCAHQIRLMPLCPVHGCCLEDSIVEVNAALGRKYVFPTRANCPMEGPRYGNVPYEKALTDMLLAFLKDDLQEESGFWCAVLSQGFKNSGLVYMELESALVYKHMLEFYGEALMCLYFREERMQQTLYRMLKGQWSSPEQYALLAVFLGLKSSWLTTPGHYLEDVMEKRLREMGSTGYLWKKQRVADELGVTTWGLDGIIKRLGTMPFWKTWQGQGNKEDDVILRVRVSREEKEEWARRAEELGAADLMEYVKWCVKRMSMK